MMSGWTDEKAARLKELAALHWTFRDIAADVGMSRNACIAKADRMGIDNGVAPYGKGLRRSTAKAPRQAPKRHNDGVMAAPMPPRPAPKNEPAPIGPIHDFPPVGTCRFIRAEIATGSDWRCCGAPAPDFGRPWCSFHRPKVYQSAATRQRDKGVSELSQIARNLRKMEAAE